MIQNNNGIGHLVVENSILFEIEWLLLSYMITFMTTIFEISSLILWLSTKRSNCHFNCATFLLPWVLLLKCPSKNVFLFYANSMDRWHCSERAHGKRKVLQLKRQQFHSLNSQSIRTLEYRIIFNDFLFSTKYIQKNL